MIPLNPHPNAEPCADAVEIWRFETMETLEAGMQSEEVTNACRVRDMWAKAAEPLTVEERVIR